ncbi:MAG: hypothetical protein F7B95_01525 [Desulfurococcales archaeon]|nr:hypothetical protein [Desulfurococcales archaeon]
MGSRYDGVGKILFVCDRCLFVPYRYALGDPKNKSKYMGAPTPEQALSGFDDLRCPSCGRKLDLRPRAIEVMSKAEFDARYIDLLFRLVPRSGVSEGVVTSGETVTAPANS